MRVLLLITAHEDAAGGVSDEDVGLLEVRSLEESVHLGEDLIDGADLGRLGNVIAAAGADGVVAAGADGGRDLLLHERPGVGGAEAAAGGENYGRCGVGIS